MPLFMSETCWSCCECQLNNACLRSGRATDTACILYVRHDTRKDFKKKQILGLYLLKTPSLKSLD